MKPEALLQWINLWWDIEWNFIILDIFMMTKSRYNLEICMTEWTLWLWRNWDFQCVIHSTIGLLIDPEKCSPYGGTFDTF